MKDLYDTLSRKVNKYRVKYCDKPVIACLSLISYLSGKLFSIMFSNHKRKVISSKSLKIGFYLWGGLGDALINLNYICYLKKYLQSEQLIIDLYLEKSSFAEFAKDIEYIDNYYVGENYNIYDYDIFISQLAFPRLLRFDSKTVSEKSSLAFDLFKKYKKFNDDNYKIISGEPYFIPMGEKLSLIQERKRIQQADINGILGMNEDFILPVKINDNEQILEKFGLKNKEFITMNRCAGSISDCHTKLWSVENYNTLIKLLKEKYSDIVIVQIGDDKTPELLTDADINLVGKTNLEELKVILKASKLHIDSEGGLVHLRKALNGGMSVVLFGPTSKEFFGYSSNINIKAEGACAGDCQWLSDNWDSLCLKTMSNNNVCMKAIEPKEVFEQINQKIKYKNRG